MKKIKKLMFFAVIMSLFTCLLCISLNAAKYSGDCGSNATWSLDTATGVLKIEGKGTMASSGNAPWYNYRSSIKTAKIADGVTSIGGSAFEGCSSLTSIEIPSSVTSIGERAFWYCSRLTSIEIPDSVTSIGSGAFSGCSSLTSITFGENSQLTSIGDGAFSGCSSLTSITIPDGVISIGGAFGNCSSLSSIEIPDSVTSIGSGAFYGCSSLTSIKIFTDTVKIYDSSDTISSSATIYGYKGSTAETYATKYGRKFVALRKIIASGTCGSNLVWMLDDEGLLKIEGTGEMEDYYIDRGGYTVSCSSPWYTYRSSIKSVEIADGVASIGQAAFYCCEAITNVIVPNSVKRVGIDAFVGCSKLLYNTYDNAKYLGNSENPYHALITTKNDYISTCTINENTKVIADKAFYYCHDLESVTMPESVESIGQYAFSNCSSLKYNIYDNAKYLGNSENPYVALIKAKDTSITDCTINDSTKVIADYAFQYCRSLIEVTIPDSIINIGNYSFSNCGSLTNITFGKESKLKNMGDYAFEACSKLGNIDIPKGVTNIGRGIFKDCSSIVNIEIPSGITSIKEYTFSFCKGLTGIIIPESVTKIENYAFLRCEALISITIPKGVTSIGNGAFDNCISLTGITIPSSVASIGDHTFYYCKSLESITILSKDVVINETSGTGTYTIPHWVKIYGYIDSTAKTYADVRRYTFVAIDKYNYMNASATLNENITMNFIGTTLTKEDVDGNDFKMTFVMNGSKTSVSPVEKNGKYTFPFAGIAPQCMNDEISYEMTMNGTVVKQGSTSVSDYLKLLIETKPDYMTDAKFKAMSTLVSDMLNYGSAAQAYTGHGTDSLLNEDYYNDIVNNYTELESTDKALSGAAPAGAKFTNVGVRFDNVNKVFFRFTADDVSKVSITINGVDYGQDKFVKTGDKYTVYSEDVLASKFDTVYTAILTYRGLDEKQIMTYSVKSFAYSFQNKRGEDGKLTAEAVLARATYTYGVSAKAYENAE